MSAGGERNWWGKRKVPAEQRGLSPTAPLAPPEAFTICSFNLRWGVRGPGLCLAHSRTPERLACRRYSVGPLCIELGFCVPRGAGPLGLRKRRAREDWKEGLLADAAASCLETGEKRCQEGGEGGAHIHDSDKCVHLRVRDGAGLGFTEVEDRE